MTRNDSWSILNWSLVSIFPAQGANDAFYDSRAPSSILRTRFLLIKIN